MMLLEDRILSVYRIMTRVEYPDSGIPKQKVPKEVKDAVDELNKAIRACEVDEK